MRKHQAWFGLVFGFLALIQEACSGSNFQARTVGKSKGVMQGADAEAEPTPPPVLPDTEQPDLKDSMTPCILVQDDEGDAAYLWDQSSYFLSELDDCETVDTAESGSTPYPPQPIMPPEEAEDPEDQPQQN